MHPTDGLGFTNEDIHEIITYINTHPAASRENTYVLDCDIDWFKESFNAVAMRTLDAIPFKGRRERELMEEALLIKDINIVYEGNGKVFLIPFNNNLGIFGLTDGDENCKILVFAYILTDIKNLTILTGLIFDSFLKAIVPDINCPAVAEELKNSSANNVICNGVSFSLFRKDNLFWYSAVSEKAPILIEEDD